MDENNKLEKLKENIFRSSENIEYALHGCNHSLIDIAYNSNGTINDKKLLELTESLTSNINFDNYEEQEQVKEFYRLFFMTTLHYLQNVCHRSDWLFISIIKISKTIELNEINESTFDYLMKRPDDINNMTKKLNKLYKNMYALYQIGYDSHFENNIRNAVFSYLENNDLSYYSDEQVLKQVAQILKNSESQILRFLRMQDRYK